MNDAGRVHAHEQQQAHGQDEAELDRRLSLLRAPSQVHVPGAFCGSRRNVLVVVSVRRAGEMPVKKR